MSLTTIDITIGIITIIYVLITLIIGIRIAAKYFTYHKKIFLFIGIAWFGMSFPLIPDVLEPIFMLTQPTISDRSLFVLYAIFNVILLPIFVALWLHALMQLLVVRKTIRYSLLAIFVILGFLYDMYLIYSSITNFHVLGTISSPFHIVWSNLVDLLLLLSLSVVLITGFICAGGSLKAEDKEVKLKGKLLMFAFSLFVLGAGIDALFTTDISNIIARSLMVVSSFSFYIGFILPTWVKRYLL
jgi:hypothetical protein